MRPLLATLLALTCLAAGVALGVRLTPARSGAPASATAGVNTEAADLAARLDRLEEKLDALQPTALFATSSGAGGQPAVGNASLEQIAAVLRHELERSGHQAPASEEQARAEQAAVEAKPENAPAQARAERVVSQALAARRWTQEDAQALRESMSALSAEQTDALLERLIPAVNRGEVTVEESGSLF